VNVTCFEEAPMQGYGRFPDKGCGGIFTRPVALEGRPCARSVEPHHVRHNAVADRAALRLVELADPTRSSSARRELAAAFSHEMDAIFTHALRLPRSRLHQFVARYDHVLSEDLVPRLAAEGVTFPRWDELSSLERLQMQHRFRGRTLSPFSPMAVDPTHPRPQVPSLALNVGMQVDGRLVLVTISPHVPRLLAVRRGRYLTAESFLGALLPQLLVGVRITEHTAFRITRSAQSDEPVRLEVERGSSAPFVHTLATRLGVADDDVYPLDSSLAMGDALAAEPGQIAPARRPPRAAGVGAWTGSVR
jgi:polyphosphate kinase